VRGCVDSAGLPQAAAFSVVTVVVTIVATVLGAFVHTLLTTPLYQASTGLFASSNADASALTGNLLSQDRVKSYTNLLIGKTWALRTVDKLGLDMSTTDLEDEVTADAELDIVLVTVEVLDESPAGAREIANTSADEFVGMVYELEDLKDGSEPDARGVVEQHAPTPDNPVVSNKNRNFALGLALDGPVPRSTVLRGRASLHEALQKRRFLE
jgi:capsular polysaccharide biosynthesis protein